MSKGMARRLRRTNRSILSVRIRKGELYFMSSGATEKQKKFAQMIAQSLGEEVPVECYESFDEMKEWIDEHIALVEKDGEGRMVFKPSEKQTSFAEAIAKRINRSIPDECYVNSRLMSEWIDGNIEEYRAAAPKKNSSYTDDTL